MEQQEQKAPLEAVLRFIEALEVGEAVAHERMTVFPVLAPAALAGQTMEYYTLAEAISEGWVEVTERPSATVPELVLRNRGKALVLVLDGEEVLGGRQNRIANASFLVAAGKEAALPVTCVEHGRWHDVSPTFKSGEQANSRLRAEKHAHVAYSLRVTGRPTADQGAVWEHVARRETELGARSDTGAMHDMYRTQEGGLAGYERAFPYAEGAVGLVVALSGHIVGADLFDQPRTARLLWPKLVRSYSLDAIGGPLVHDQTTSLVTSR